MYLGGLNDSYIATFAAVCLCENKAFDPSVRIGRYMLPGKGRWKCVCCSHLCHKLDDCSDLHASMSRSKRRLERHLDSAQCQTSRNFEQKLTAERKLLSDKVTYAVDIPKYNVVDESSVNFNCRTCISSLMYSYSNWYNHGRRAIRNGERSLQNT